MSTTYSPQIKRYNGTDWDLINPKTLAENVSYESTTVKAQLDICITTSQKGVASGVASLDSNAKILVDQLPDFLVGQVLYGGIIESAGVATVSTNAKTKIYEKTGYSVQNNTLTLLNQSSDTYSGQYITGLGYTTAEGIYFISNTSFTFAGISFAVGDWVISTGSAWKKVDNTDAVTSVNDKTGAVVLYGSDILYSSGGSTLNSLIDGKVPTSRTINSKALSSNITLYGGDIAMSSSDSTSLYTAINNKQASLGTGQDGYFLKWAGTSSGGNPTWSAVTFENSWRVIKLNGSNILGTTPASSYPLDFIDGINTAGVWDSTNHKLQFNLDITLGNTAPSNPVTGTLWFDTTA